MSSAGVGQYGSWVWNSLSVMTGSLMEGAKTVVSSTVSGVVSGGKKTGMFMVESVGGSVGMVGNTVMQGVGHLGVGVLQLGAMMDYEATPEDMEYLSSLHDDVSRMTSVGRLPNAPGFDNALGEKTNTLGPHYTQSKQNLPQGGNEEQTLNLIDGIDLNGATRGGNAQALSPDEFHTALLLGAHFTTSDTALYDQVANGTIGGFQARGSSHYKGRPDQQYGMDIPGLGHLLIGKSSDDRMFFQFESHGLGNPNMSRSEKIMEGVGHTLSYVQHITGDVNYVQLGPMGCISSSEKDGQQVVLQ